MSVCKKPGGKFCMDFGWFVVNAHVYSIDGIKWFLDFGNLPWIGCLCWSNWIISRGSGGKIMNKNPLKPPPSFFVVHLAVNFILWKERLDHMRWSSVVGFFFPPRKLHFLGHLRAPNLIHWDFNGSTRTMILWPKFISWKFVWPLGG